MLKYLPSLLILFLSCSEPEGCGTGYTEIYSQCYNQDDLAVLQQFIDNSIATISMTLDADTSGTIEPLELQIQKWNENGRLTFLWLEDKQLSGNIPWNIGSLTQLDTLHLGYNQFSDEIPEGIGNLTKLNWLYLYLNDFSGIIPDTICNIYQNLDNFLIYQNQFCPPYPSCIPIEKIGTQDTAYCL